MIISMSDQSSPDQRDAPGINLDDVAARPQKSAKSTGFIAAAGVELREVAPDPWQFPDGKMPADSELFRRRRRRHVLGDQVVCLVGLRHAP